MRPQTSTSLWLPFFLKNGEMTIPSSWAGYVAVSFSLLRLAIQCRRGARSLIGHYVVTTPPMDLVRVESNLSAEAR